MMKHFELMYIIDNQESENKLEELAKRCENLNGWSEKDLVQFAVNAYPLHKVLLMFLEDIINDLESKK